MITQFTPPPHSLPPLVAEPLVEPTNDQPDPRSFTPQHIPEAPSPQPVSDDSSNPQPPPLVSNQST